jgi:hypothetical protein
VCAGSAVARFRWSGVDSGVSEAVCQARGARSFGCFEIRRLVQTEGRQKRSQNGTRQKCINASRAVFVPVRSAWGLAALGPLHPQYTEISPVRIG